MGRNYASLTLSYSWEGFMQNTPRVTQGKACIIPSHEKLKEILVLLCKSHHDPPNMLVYCSVFVCVDLGKTRAIQGHQHTVSIEGFENTKISSYSERSLVW